MRAESFWVNSLDNIGTAKVGLHHKKSHLVNIIIVFQMMVAHFTIQKFLVPYFSMDSKIFYMLCKMLPILAWMGESAQFNLRIIEPITIRSTANDHHFVTVLNCISRTPCHFEIINMFPSIFVSSNCRRYNRPFAGSISQTTNDIHRIGCWNGCIPTKAKQKFTAEIKDHRLLTMYLRMGNLQLRSIFQHSSQKFQLLQYLIHQWQTVIHYKKLILYKRDYSLQTLHRIEFQISFRQTWKFFSRN